MSKQSGDGAYQSETVEGAAAICRSGLCARSTRVDSPRPQVSLKAEFQLRDGFGIRPRRTVQHRGQRCMVQPRRRRHAPDTAVPDGRAQAPHELACHFTDRVIRRFIRPADIPLPRTQPLIARHTSQITGAGVVAARPRAESTS